MARKAGIHRHTGRLRGGIANPTAARAMWALAKREKESPEKRRAESVSGMGFGRSAKAPYPMMAVSVNMARATSPNHARAQPGAGFLEREGGLASWISQGGDLLDPGKMPPGERALSAGECYRFALSNPFVHVAITGPKNEEELRHALRAMPDGPLDPEEMARVRAVGDFVHAHLCRRSLPSLTGRFGRVGRFHT